MNRFCMTLAGALLALSAMPAQAANFWGDLIKPAWRGPSSPYTNYPATFSANPLVVGAGVEGFVELQGTHIDIDFSETSLLLSVPEADIFSGYAFWGLVFENLTDAGNFGVIQSVSGIDASRVQVLGNLLAINLSGLHTPDNYLINVNFVSDVPEPASWALMMAGFGLAGATMRRRAGRLVLA